MKDKDFKKPLRRRSAGFTLVEIALAILVVSIGLLSVFSLFPAGLVSNKAAIDDTYSAMFAEEVFYGYRAQVSVNPWASIESLTVPSRSPEKWAFTDQQIVRANRGWQTVQYRPLALGGEAIDYALRYNFIVQRHPENPDNRAFALLEVLAGEVGPTNNPVRFYTEFFNTGS
jgi:type II secretory pathway pseudopilin PulG